MKTALLTPDDAPDPHEGRPDMAAIRDARLRNGSWTLHRCHSNTAGPADTADMRTWDTLNRYRDGTGLPPGGESR